MLEPALCRAGASVRGRIGLSGRRGLLDVSFALLRFGSQLGVLRATFAEQTLARMGVRNLVEWIGQLGVLGAGRARIGHAGLLQAA
jgi:hypothetical protein